MRAIWTIAKREILSFFVSPVGYIVIATWLIVQGACFFVLANAAAQSPTQALGGGPLGLFFGGSILFYVPLFVFPPALTMRLLAEERHTGTLEPLLTAPVSTWHVVAGKYLAGVTFWLSLWVPTLLYVWLTSRFGDVDLGMIASTYIGIFCTGLYYTAIGLMMSALVRTQVAAALLSAGVLFVLFAMSLLSFFGVYEDVLNYVSLWGHMQAFSKGIVDTRFIVFDVSVTVLFVYLTWRVLEGRRWQ